MSNSVNSCGTVRQKKVDCIELRNAESEGNRSVLVVGAGIFGAVIAHELHRSGISVAVVDRRSHIGGNCYTRDYSGIEIHEYGPHIAHTDDKSVWTYLNRFAEFNSFVNCVMAYSGGQLYNLPFNMNTFRQVWGVNTPKEVNDIIARSKVESSVKPDNLEDFAISSIGRELYSLFVEGYTEKQWGRPCRDLPASIIRRIPVRFTFNNSYFTSRYQGVPIGGYTRLIDKMLSGITVRLGVSSSNVRAMADDARRNGTHVVWTGAIDEYYDYSFGALEYRSLSFEHTMHAGIKNLQGTAVINYCDKSVPYTRSIEHKHFAAEDADRLLSLPYTVVTEEYPAEWSIGAERYYPVNDARNTTLYEKYADLARMDSLIDFGGRLGSYAYMDIGDTVKSALSLSNELISKIKAR